MRKYSMIMMALALLVGMAQCKKEPTNTNNGNTESLSITLKVDNGNNGDRLNVYPATGAVIFTEGDVIYVGNNGKYVGTLTFDNGLFQGTVSGDLSTNDYLHFYFVGNKPTSPSTFAAGTTTYTVDISDQSTGLPAISYAPSTAKYSPSTTAYTAKLLNKSALVKFVPSLSTSQPITVSGLNNEVQIDFANHTLAPTGNTDGGITLYSESESEKWAVLLEQASLSGLTVSVDGYNSTIDGTTLPSAITNNMYYNTGIGIAMTATYRIYEADNSNWASVLASFNAEPTFNPMLKLTEDITINNNQFAITRANGTINLNGHTFHYDNTGTHALFLQNNVLGESLTIMNGTIEAPVDGNQGWNHWYCGTVIFENVTFKNDVFFDGHLCELTNVDFAAGSKFQNYTGGSGNPGLVIINSGKFNCTYHQGGGSNTKGLTTIYGGKFSTNPSSIANVTIPEGYSIRSNTDSDSGTYPWVVSVLPVGAINGEFTINASGDKVYFSKGNLQYTKSTGVWSFMEHQYDIVETLNQWVGNDYAGQDVVSLFCYGTSGYNYGATVYQPWSTTNRYADCCGSNLYDINQADWGYNAIANGGNKENSGWRTLTRNEWSYLFNTRTASTVNNVANARYAKAQVAGVHGVILFPDSYTHPNAVGLPTGINATGDAGWNGNNYTADDFELMEVNGAVFLPAAGYRLGDPRVYYVGSDLQYWTSYFSGNNNGSEAASVNISSSGLNPSGTAARSFGLSVRLVRNVQ